jgi:hypothetical protein
MLAKPPDPNEDGLTFQDRIARTIAKEAMALASA